MRNPFRRTQRRDPASWSAGAPHPFQEVRDAGLSAFAAGGGGFRGGQAITPVAATSRFERMAGCAVPGCGRAPADPIHASAED